MMSDQCAKVRITYGGGFAGTVPRVDLTRSGLGEANARTMDEVCRQLLTLAETQVSGTAKLGADMAYYRVEIERANGEKRSFTIPDTVVPKGSTLENSNIGALVDRLANLSHSAR
jgi:hypothetical protein